MLNVEYRTSNQILIAGMTMVVCILLLTGNTILIALCKSKSESSAKIWYQLNAFKPQCLRLMSVLRRWFCFYSLLTVNPIMRSVIVLCVAVRYFMSILVLQSS